MRTFDPRAASERLKIVSLLAGEVVMHIQRLVIIIAAASASMTSVYAGPCTDEIGGMQAKINAKVEATAAAGPPAPPSAMVGMSAQPTPRSMAAVEERMGEISPQTVQAMEQAMARARAADGAGDKAACEQALAEVEHILSQ